MSVSELLDLAGCPRLGDGALSEEILADEDVGERFFEDILGTG